MKIFEFQINGEKEWVTASGILQAVQCYIYTTSMNIEDFQEDDDIIEVPESKWDDMVIYHDEEMESEETFAEAIKRLNGRADFLATTAS